MENVTTKEIEDELFLVEEEDDSNQTVKYLLFNLGDEEYGVDISKVIGIEELQKITRIPDMPDFMKGVINLRGKVIPVIDLRLRFGMEERSYDDRTCIVISDIKGLSMGFIVDTVKVVIDLDETLIDPPTSLKSDSDREGYIMGLARIDDEVKILIDVEKIIHEDDMNLIHPTDVGN